MHHLDSSFRKDWLSSPPPLSFLRVLATLLSPLLNITFFLAGSSFAFRLAFLRVRTATGAFQFL